MLGEREFLFLMNFTPSEQRLELGGAVWQRLESEDSVSDVVLLPFASEVLVRTAQT